MIATLPPWLQDTISAWPLIAALSAALGWAMRRQRAWVREHISDPIAETQHLVKYHLGPNGSTKPIHKRVHDIERGLGIEETD